jgi:hypothetical protein
VITGAAGYTYTYDGDGNRMRKSNGNLAANGTLYWYMTPGVVAESDLAGTLKSKYVFFNGERSRDGAIGRLPSMRHALRSSTKAHTPSLQQKGTLCAECAFSHPAVLLVADIARCNQRGIDFNKERAVRVHHIDNHVLRSQ